MCKFLTDLYAKNTFYNLETALEIDTVLEKITRGKSLILVSHNANLGFWVDKIVKINP